MSKIQAVRIDRSGNLLFLKNFEQQKDKFFIEYRSMLNDIPFQRVQIYLLEQEQSFVITGDDGTVLYRFHVSFALNASKDEPILESSE